ncbi:hypothetical protein EVG20_g11650 [Dentipellis fragilis]|uniref:Uncharacterized protein n=1 Tax=Dentipellis fragilis TaxID=205917 RepID=A0A4Y9XLK8_9AGAM|nr:hypothetical protein EVG20_g11650 [Dentipellis fragilis]
MHEQKRNRVRPLALLVNILDIERPEILHGDVAREMGQRIELGLRRAPVVPVGPARDETLHVCEWYAIVPPGVVEFVGESHLLELVLQQGEGIIGDGDLERLFG